MRVFLGLAGLFLVSCGSPEALRVRQFHLRETTVTNGHPFIRAEMNQRLYGAVTARERKLRRGNYYHLRWQELSGKEPVRVVFEYRLAKTGARIKRRELRFPPARKGEFEIAITGREYVLSGHVQSWRVTLYEGERKVAVKKSYLWE